MGVMVKRVVIRDLVSILKVFGFVRRFEFKGRCRWMRG